MAATREGSGALDLAECGSSSGEDETPVYSSAMGKHVTFTATSIQRVITGHRPSVSFIGTLTSTSMPAGGTSPSVLDGHAEEVVLTIRYEPPSAKFIRQHPHCASYRLTLSKGNEHMYSSRDLPRSVDVDRQHLRAEWGKVCILLSDAASFQALIGCLRHVDVVDAALGPPDGAALQQQGLLDWLGDSRAAFAAAAVAACAGLVLYIAWRRTQVGGSRTNLHRS